MQENRMKSFITIIKNIFVIISLIFLITSCSEDIVLRQEPEVYTKISRLMGYNQILWTKD